MNILVCYRINRQSTKMSGVFKKMLGQLQGLEQAGAKPYALYMDLNRQVLARYEKGQLCEVKVWQPIAIEGEQTFFWDNGRDAFEQVPFDAVYVRYDQMYLGTSLATFMSAAKASGVLTSIEFPTFPYEKEIKDLDKLSADLDNRKTLQPVTDFSFSTCFEKSILGIPNTPFNNKVAVDSKAISKYEGPLIDKDRTLHMLSVANVNFWHGFDRVLDGLAKYVSNGNPRKVYYHIVGDGNDVIDLKMRCAQLGLNNWVTFHGFCHPDNLKEYYDLASVCVAGVGLHRKNIFQNSALKVREYVANGLPIVMSTIDTDLTGLASILKVPQDDSPLDIQKICNFVESIDEQVGVRNSIRHFARENLSWKSHAQIMIERFNKEGSLVCN